MRRRVAGICSPGRWLFLGLFWLHGSVTADERILEYASDILLDADAGMTVTETIRVRSEGDNIRRGIYRDFPTRYTDSLGNAYRVSFEVQSVRRDGALEPWFSEGRSNGMRIYIGSADRQLPPGEHSYALTYRTSRQIGYFEDHDELYWNVTGNGWMFPIDAATAEVTLPEPVPAEALTMEGYTGRLGSRERAFASRTAAGAAAIAATRGLGPGEGLTLVLSFPKGVVHEPDAMERTGQLLTDNLGLLAALVTLTLVVGFLLHAWRRYGRDPEAGVTFAHYEPPEGYSPGAVRFINRMGYDGGALTAAIVSLAVKGCLTISKDDDTYELTRTGSVPKEALGPGEEALLDALFEKGGVLTLDDESYEAVGGARKAHRKSLRRHYYRAYFLNNSQWLVPSVLVTLMVLVLLIIERLVTPAVVVVFVVNLGVQGLFLYLLKAPTRRGRALMDRLAGFELYLKVAEQDDLNIAHPPELTPALFERYLPFAIALGVANEWGERFARVLSKLEASQRLAYSPAWYSGDFSPHHLDGFVQDVGSSFSTAIASAATPPGSSSGGGGGGFSGGGGGGGGGGGW